MTLHTTWAACAGSIARCIAATTPPLADSMFGAMREAGGSSEIGWHRMSSAEVAGFVWLAPLGGDLRFQALPPPGFELERLPMAPAVPRGRLRAEAEAFLRDARVLAGGGEIAINGGRLKILPSGAAVAAAERVVTLLEGATALFEGSAVARLLRDVAIRFLRELPQDGPGAVERVEQIEQDQRANFSADGKLWALSRLRMAAAAPLVCKQPTPPALYRLFDPFGPGADPDQAFSRAVDEVAQTEIEALLAASLARADAARERALESRSVVAHGTALFEAAGEAWTAMRLAEALSFDEVAVSARDTVMRATQALVVESINLGSGSALLRHQALIAIEGPAKADELIETCWFYPRALRATLMAQSPATA